MIAAPAVMLMFVVGPVPGARAASRNFPPGYLSLAAGQQIAVGNVALKLTSTNDLQIVNMASQAVLWHTNTAANCATTLCGASFQGDANLVVYTLSGGVRRALWTSNTCYTCGKNWGTSLFLSDDPTKAYLTVFGTAYNPVWTANHATAPAGLLATALSTTTATPVQSFLGSLGVNTHLSQGMDVLGCNDPTPAIAKLSYLGVYTVRDSFGAAGGNCFGANLMQAYATLSGNGVRFDVLMGPPVIAKPIPAPIAQITGAEALAADLAPGSLLSLEGPNEINNFAFTCNGSTWQGGWSNPNGPAAQCYMSTYYSQLAADSNLTGTSMLDLGAGNSALNADQYGLLDLAGQADYGNVHIYPSYLKQPYASFPVALGQTYHSVFPPQAQVTEFGYSTMAGGDNANGGAVDARTQAILLINGFLDAYSAGFARTFAYMLTDYPGDGYGFFPKSGCTPANIAACAKPSAQALHNLTTLLGDPGQPVATPGTLNYAVAGLPANGHLLLLQKSTGTFELVVWQEPQIWNGTGEIPVSPSTVTVTFPVTKSAVNVYNPFADGFALHYSNVGSVTLQLGTEAQIVETP